MTAPVFIMTPRTLEPAGGAQTARIGDMLTLTGTEARHAVTVRRLQVGERVDLVDGAGLRLVCEVVRAGANGARDRLTARVRERVEEAESTMRMVLVQALAKSGRDEQAVETATELGVDAVVPWQAERCVSVWRGTKVAKGRTRWQATAREAAKQARRARVPEVGELLTTRSLTRWVRETTQTGGVVLVLHEEAAAPIGGVRLPDPDDRERPMVAVIVGPEGGIGAEETAALQEAGAMTVRLGPHVMRTASAGPVALAVLAQRAGLWG